MITRGWVVRQLLSLAAVVVGVLLAQAVDGHGWGASGWAILLAVWAALAAVELAVRSRRGTAEPAPPGSG
ncbi:hypothetical protein [Angustibacter luteus]|uniref:Uncharacterized protein n=1 Tax=Angustibacter luteus TaxID=658456 RepID=A0ABW1JJL4_9ACTN